MYKIYGKYPGQPREVIDEFDTEAEAKNMLIEYMMIFGPGWSLYIKYTPK